MDGSSAPRNAGFSTAASRGYALVSAWEKNTTLDSFQLSAVSALGDCHELPEPVHLADESLNTTVVLPETPRAVDDEEAGHHFKGDWEHGVLRTNNQFYKWFSELSVLRRQQIEGEYGEYLGTLSKRLDVTRDITGRVGKSLHALEDLTSHHRDVSMKMAQVKKSCERLMHEKEMLIQYANALAARLGCFDELEAIAVEFHQVSASQESADVLPLLSRLDDCLTYMSSNPQYVDTMAYTLRLRQLQGKAIMLIFNKVQAILQRGIAVVKQDALKPAPLDRAPSTATPSASALSTAASLNETGTLDTPSSTAAALQCVRFRAAVEAQLAPILKALSERSGQGEYQRLLESVEGAFCSARSTLALPIVQKYVAELQAQLSLRDLARQGCAYLYDVCRSEAALAGTFFPSPRPSSALSALLEALCNVLYDALRPHYIQLHSLDDLVDLVDVLRQAASTDVLSHRDAAASQLLEPTVARITADVQERLIYRASAFMREEVGNFQPSPADVDFPACLVSLQDSIRQRSPSTESLPLIGVSPSGVPAVPPTPNETTGPAVLPEDDYNTWYPPLRQTLLCLAKLYRSVELAAFCGLGQDALIMCTRSIQQASKLVERSSGALDGQLFTIRHLLLLREQISPFQAEFKAMDRDLDFSHMRGQLQRVMMGQMPLFNLSSSSSVMQLVASGGVRVLENQIDSKKDLEKTLKGCCESYIMTVTKAVVEPMLSFLHKVTAARNAASRGGAASKAISKQAFASPDKLVAVVAAVNQALDRAYPAATQKMKLYLGKPKTQQALLKPIKSNIVEAHGHIATLLTSEYSADEAAAVPLMDTESLQALLNAQG